MNSDTVQAAPDANVVRRPRPYIGMLFRCCQIYLRVYLNRAGDAYVGHCPRCAARIAVKMSPTGSNARFFSAG